MYVRLVPVAVFILLSGCISAVPEVETIDEPVTDLKVDFQNCTGSVAFSLQPFAAADTFLPPGYHAEDASQFFSATAGTSLPDFNQALFGLILTDCTMSHTGKQEYLSVAWILLETPNAEWENDPADFEWYELFRYTDGPSLPESLADLYWHAEIGNITTGVLSNPPYLAARTWQMGDVFSMSHEGSGAPISATGKHRTWSSHQAGTTTYEFDLSAQLLLGPGVCSATPGHWTWEFIGGGCGDVVELISPDLQYAAFAGLELDGHFHFEKDGFVK